MRSRYCDPTLLIVEWREAQVEHPKAEACTSWELRALIMRWDLV